MMRVEADVFGWFYATGECGMGGDKAGFHAIGAMGGIDEQATFVAKSIEISAGHLI